MLAKKFRLSNKKDFERLHKNGKFFGNNFLAIKVAKNDLEISRFGFAIGKKISKKAVIRNKVRRRLQENIRIKMPKIKPGFDIIFFAREEIGKKDYWEIDKEINKIFEKAGLIKI